MKQHNGIVRVRRPSVFQEVFIDATLQAVGGVWGTKAYSEPLPTELIGLSITLLEMYNILIALRVWGVDWKDKCTLIRCDNESAVVVCTSGRTRDPFLNFCLREIWFITAKFNIELRVTHIRGRDNGIADALSRGKTEKLRDLCIQPVSSVLPLYCRSITSE